MKKITSTIFLIFALFLTTINAVAAQTQNCGEIVTDPNSCQCADNDNHTANSGIGVYCCGYYLKSTDPRNNYYLKSTDPRNNTDRDFCFTYEDTSTYGCGETNSSASVPAGASCNCAGASWQPYTQSNILGLLDRGVCCGWPQDKDGYGFETCNSTDPAITNVSCGETYEANSGKTCTCSGGGVNPINDGSTTICCGFLQDGVCNSSDSGLNDIEVTDKVLDDLNPLTIAGTDKDLSTPGKIISRALGGFVFPVAGLILFMQLVLGGFQMLTGAANSKSIDEGKQKITSAIVGFIILFAAYWIAQLLELIFSIRILS